METALNHDAERRGRQDVVDSNQPPPAKRISSPTRIKLYPDMWLLRCDKDDKDESKVPILVVEYKAAHKMRASTVKVALQEGDPDTEGFRRSWVFLLRLSVRNCATKSTSTRV
jgi:hypothetical protein